MKVIATIVHTRTEITAVYEARQMVIRATLPESEFGKLKDGDELEIEILTDSERLHAGRPQS